jgi:hypothetical protein
MSYGFKKVINETSQGIKKNNPQAQAFYYAMHCLVFELMLSFSGYIQEPRNAWAEIIKLFRYAEGLGLGLTAVTNQLLSTDQKTDIRTEFKRIVLLLLLDPFRLEHNEIWQAYDYLAHWAARAQIGPMPAHQEQDTGCFLLEIRGLQKPQGYNHKKPPATPGHYLLLNCLPLNAEINNQIKHLKESKPAPIPGAEKATAHRLGEMLRHMLLAWHVCPERRHHREERHDWLQVCCGINSVNHFLTQGSLIESQQTQDKTTDDTDEHLVISSYGHNTTQAHLTHRWRQTNISMSGAGLMIPPNDQSHLQVGQLVMLESEQDIESDKPRIGVVRRLIRHDAETLEAGIQFIQGLLSPAQIKPVIFGRQERADFQPALLLNRGAKYPPALFTPQMIYQPNREYIIETAQGETLKFFAEKLLESTRCYERFEYRLISFHDLCSSVR